jgi:predicted kinase
VAAILPGASNAIARSRNPNAARILENLGLPARAGSGAALFLLTGLPGTGKSTFARALRELTGAVVLESDRLRCLLFEQPVHSQRESAILFRAIRSAAARLLVEGQAVIIDSTSLSETDRWPFYNLADSLGLPLFIAAFYAPARVVEERLAKRLLEADGYRYATWLLSSNASPQSDQPRTLAG